MNLFDKYGGAPTISKIVTNFYGKILSRPHLKAYFAGVPLPKLIQHQVRFMSQVMGQTPSAYNGRAMDLAHERLNITAAHFGEVAQILEACLHEAGMAADDLASVMAAVASLQDALVSPGQAPRAQTQKGGS
jgi:truncated hemoglobin YjbI